MSEEALEHLECITHWEQICAADPSRTQVLELQRTKARYLAGAENTLEFAIVGQTRKAVQLSLPGKRRVVATVKLEKDTALYKGPNNFPGRCALPNCADVPDCVAPEDTVTLHFVSDARLEQRLRELMPLVPQKQCPATVPEYTPPLAGEKCLDTGKPYTPATAATRRKTSVSLDSQPLRLFLSGDERTHLDKESKPLLEALRVFYASRLAQAPKARGKLTARLHFPEGGRKPEISIQQDEPHDEKLTQCLSAALRSRDLFPWRPAPGVDLELSFIFTP